MRFFTYAPVLALAAIAAAAPIPQASETAQDLTPVKLNIGAKENAPPPAVPQVINEGDLGGVDNSNKDQNALVNVAVKVIPKFFKEIADGLVKIFNAPPGKVDPFKIRPGRP